MSIEIVEKQIAQFISNDNPEIMAIRGHWGVGKTYTWGKYLRIAKDENRISLEKYSYVSLFGINSLESFKYSIFENVINRRLIGVDPNLETFKENSRGIFEIMGRKAFSSVGSVFFANRANKLVESLSFLSLRKTLVCIDDLERKGKDLDVRDVLGLVLQLKEQKKCKVVLLLNDGEAGIADYSKYSEKVVDIELVFSPTAAECTRIAYEKTTYEFTILRELSEKLGIRNIRVLKKAERLVGLVEPLLLGFEQETKREVIASLILFTWCYYCSKSDENIPTLEFVSNQGYSSFGIGEEADNEKEKGWKSLLRSYGYQLTDDLDLVLAGAVRNGYFDEANFKLEVMKKNEAIKASKAEGSFSKAWRIYHDSFDNNADEVVNQLYVSFKNNVKHISLTNLNGVVRLFRDLNFSDKASEMIDMFIHERRTEVELFDLAKSNFFGDVIDHEIVEKFDNLHKASLKVESVSDVLKRMAEGEGWSSQDELVLANTSVDDFYSFFKAINGAHLSTYVNKCLQFGRFSNASSQQKEIASRTELALKRIALESAINMKRVQKFGVKP